MAVLREHPSRANGTFYRRPCALASVEGDTPCTPAMQPEQFTHEAEEYHFCT